MAGGGDVTDAGIDLSEEAFAPGVDGAGARVLCAWLNANVATSFIEVSMRFWRFLLFRQSPLRNGLGRPIDPM